MPSASSSQIDSSFTFFLRNSHVPVLCSLPPASPVPSHTKAQPQLKFSQEPRDWIPVYSLFGFLFRIHLRRCSCYLCPSVLGLQVQPSEGLFSQQTQQCVCLCASHQRPAICGLYATVIQNDFSTVLVLVYFLFSDGPRSSSRPLPTSVCLPTPTFLYYMHRVLHKHYIAYL